MGLRRANACVVGHHPVFGEPVLSPESVIDTGARLIELDDGSEVPDTDLAVGGSWAWPVVRNRRGEDVDMSRAPGPGTGFSRVLYLKDFSQGWYALTNPNLEIGVGLVWDRDLFPYACFWQETGGETGHPFFGKAVHHGHRALYQLSRVGPDDCDAEDGNAPHLRAGAKPHPGAQGGPF